MTKRPPLAAISYAHGEYDDEVIALADRLNLEDVDCELDVYSNAPPEGWARWIERMMRERTVLVIASEDYYKRFHLEEDKGIGLGATFEGGLLAERVYEMQGRNEGIIPVLLAVSDEMYIPEFLRDVARYDLSKPDGYEQLYRRLTNQPQYVKPPLGELRTMPAHSSGIETAVSQTSAPRGIAGLYKAEIAEALEDAAGQGGLLIFSFVCAISLIVHPTLYRPDRFAEENERNIIASARQDAAVVFPISGPEKGVNLEDGFQVTTALSHDLAEFHGISPFSVVFRNISFATGS